MKRQVTEALRQTFRPEFLNRIDEIIVFHSLTDEDLDRIVDLLLAELQARLADRDLTLELTPAARAVIARDGHDPQFGARPLKRALQRLVENPLARALLEGQFAPGAHIRLDADPVGGTLVFSGADGARGRGRLQPIGMPGHQRNNRSRSGGQSLFDLPGAPEGPERTGAAELAERATTFGSRDAVGVERDEAEDVRCRAGVDVEVAPAAIVPALTMGQCSAMASMSMPESSPASRWMSVMRHAPDSAARASVASRMRCVTPSSCIRSGPPRRSVVPGKRCETR